MDARSLSARPSLEQYRKQAKDLVSAHKAGDAEALRRIQDGHPRFAGQSESAVRTARFALADAQFLIAREHGFESWPRFSKHIQETSRDRSPGAIWESALKAVLSGDAATLDRLLSEHPAQFKEQRPPTYGPGGLRPDYCGGDAQTILVQNHHFESWDQFTRFVDEMKQPNSPTARFEQAVKAVVTGDLPTLERLLRNHPALIRQRSTRKHHSTLLHYVGANGVEDFNQRTPRNAVEVLTTLLGGGADVDSPAEMYGGGSTTLGLVATSIHPLQAGVQEDLIEALLRAGAAIGGPGTVNSCLANGRKEAAELLARRGAPLDLEGAAGVGRLDLVRSFFDEQDRLGPNATRTQMVNAYAWACEYGRTEVVDFLLQRGIRADESTPHRGQTGLHWAAYGAHAPIVNLLLQKGAPVEVKDAQFGSTPIGWALHGWTDPPTGTDTARYPEVVRLLVEAGATVHPYWLSNETVRADPAMSAALQGATPAP